MRIRVGKNIFFKITVNRLDDEPEDFTDARNVRLTVNRKYSSYQVSPLLTIRDNIIEFEFVGGGDAISGQYELHLYYEKLNEASVSGVDKFYLDFCNAFILVDLTCKEDTEFESESPSINLKGVIERNKDGKDGLTPFIGDNDNWWIGNVDTGKPSRGKAFEYSDFTREQIEELQKPASDMISELDKTNNAVKTNEQQRIDNENARVSSENARKESEDTRKSAENTRASNEEARKTAEAGRTSAEGSRVKSEQSRVDAESNRVKAENTRVEKENARQTAETTRDTNEQSRKQAEASRVTAEQGRVTEFNRLKTESETATTNATTQANYAKSQGDSVAGTVNEIKTAQSSLLTRVNEYMYEVSALLGKLGYRNGVGVDEKNVSQQEGYYDINGKLKIQSSGFVYQKLNIDPSKIYGIKQVPRDFPVVSALVLFDKNDEIIKTVAYNTSSFSSNSRYFVFAGVYSVGISFIKSDNNSQLKSFDISDLTTVLNTSQGNRALYVAAGAVYNERTGFYELNGLTDITEEQMRVIYNSCCQNPNIGSLQERYSYYQMRTNFRFEDNYGAWIGGFSVQNMCYGCTSLEVFAVSSDSNFLYISNCSRMFLNCSKLKTIQGRLKFNSTITNYSLMFGGCVLLETVKCNGIVANISFSASPLLSLESLQYLITNATNTSAITVTVHADVYAKIQDETQTDWHALVAAAQEKQITFATA